MKNGPCTSADVHKFEKGDDDARKRVYTLYLKNTKYINNWDS